MAKRAVSSLSADFSTPDPPGILLRQEGAGVGGIQLRLYPAVPAIVFATNGVATLGETRLHRVQWRLAKFNFENRVRTEFPAAGNLTINPAAPGRFFNRLGQEIYPTFQLDLDTSEIVASEVCFGGASVAYDAFYRVIHYTPDATPSAEVLALYGDEIASIAVQFTSAEYLSLATLYEVVSTTIADPVDTWEKPKDWPNDNTYPITNSGPNKKNFMEQLRVHEVGRIDRFGIWRWETNYYVWERPYLGSSGIGYQPEYQLRRASPPVGFENIFLKAPWARINQRLAALYPDISES